MNFTVDKKIRIISAPSILGLKPNGVEKLASTLIEAGIATQLNVDLPVLSVTDYNQLYTTVRDPETNMINSQTLRDFSIELSSVITQCARENFLLVLGGDCSILIGIVAGLKDTAEYGLVFIDAHADFYQPDASPTGEAADMDLAVVTGRGPEILTNIGNKKPYIAEKNVIHIGQRDQEETKKYGSQNIRDSGIACWDLETLRTEGVSKSIDTLLKHINSLTVSNFWIHFDADVLDDTIMPAVDYRLSGGLTVNEATAILKALLRTGKISGMSITVYNPALDKNKQALRILMQITAEGFN